MTPAVFHLLRFYYVNRPIYIIRKEGKGGRLAYQPLFGKGARAPPPKALGEGRLDTRERRKSSL